MKKTVLKIKNLSKSYKKKIVFKNLNLNIYENDILALLGSNGAGKTTLTEIISDIKKYDSGEIFFLGSKKDFLHNLNVCFQEGGYPYGIRVYDMILLFSNVFYVDEDEYLFEQLKINEILYQSMNRLSFGQRKRVELYLALFSKTKYIILDEITSGVDVWMRIIILNILNKYSKKNNLTIIYITHNFEEIKKICNRAVLLCKKGIVLDINVKQTKKIQEIIENKIIELEKNE